MPAWLKPAPLSRPAGFTLVELLVVIAIIALLASLLLPSLASARQAGWKAACISNLRQVGIAMHTYAHENDGRIPYGPKAPPFVSPASFYPATGTPTSLISLQSGSPVGLGLLLQSYLAARPKVLFCPGADQPLDADAELAKVGAHQAQGSYYYRHGGNTQLFDSPVPTNSLTAPRLDSLGENRAGVPIRALALDTQFVSSLDLDAFNVKTRTHHQRRLAIILYSDGHASARQNKDGQFTVDLLDYSEIRQAFDRILKVFERADAAL